MGYRAKILCHSVGPACPPLMTAEVEYPRIVLAETVTHRTCRDAGGEYELITAERTTTEDMSKNSASSRAIPLWQMIKKVVEDPFIPDRFSKTGPGMQAAGWLEGDDDTAAKARWCESMINAIRGALNLASAAERQKVFENVPWTKTAFRDADLYPPLSHGVHKQDVNRLLEPFAWITQVITADDIGWNNFFALRCHAAAHPAFQKIARMLYLLYRKSTPTKLDYGQWHLPFVDTSDAWKFSWQPDPTRLYSNDLPDLIKFSAARCGWVSYENHDRDGTPESMRKTFERFVASPPIHASPVEHQATPMHPVWQAAFPRLRSNLNGWVQARKLIGGERTEKYQPTEEEVQSWGLPI